MPQPRSALPLSLVSLLWFAVACSPEPPPREPGFWAAAAPVEMPIPEELAGICRAGPRTHPRDTLAPPTPAPRGPDVRVVPTESPDELQLSGSSGPFRCVVRSEAEWHALWSSEAWGGFPPPAADFGRYTVLVATMGAQRSSGYNIRIDSVFATGDSVTAIVWQYFPPMGAIVSDGPMWAQHVVRIVRTDLPVRFLERIGENPQFFSAVP